MLRVAGHDIKGCVGHLSAEDGSTLNWFPMMEAVGGEAECRKAEVFEDVSCLRRRSGGAMNSMVTVQ